MAEWFRASEATGDFMGIRYGRIPKGGSEVEWSCVSHCDCDGIGGFARLLRGRGLEIGKLPETRNPCRELIAPLWRLWRESRVDSECADRRDWEGLHPSEKGGSKAVAWHLFSEEETRNIRANCRSRRVTVNSHLLKHLDQAVRPEIRRPHARIPWMIPVNLRGDINRTDDTENHVSCVNVSIAEDDSVEEVQNRIRQCLERGQHRANYLIMAFGRFLSHEAKVKFLVKDRSRPEGTIGAFSNLGVWDAGKRTTANDSWLFCPPVVSGQLLGAGCVTFQGRLGLAIQEKARLPLSAERASGWMKRWVAGSSRGC